MKSLVKLLLGFAMILLCTCAVKKQGWPEWERFKQLYISVDGRVSDQKKTTSEGQSYALFFALVANDRITFNKLLTWTINNLCQGDIDKHLPAWLWGLDDKNNWGVLDENSASDSDLWIAYDLLEAGRLWNNPDYTLLGEKLLDNIARQELINLPGQGLMLMPGKVGFLKDTSLRINPSYFPIQVLNRLGIHKGIWQVLAQKTPDLLQQVSPRGFAPDWILWEEGKGWQPDSEHPDLGSYAAIRVYLWVGMLADTDPAKHKLKSHFQPMVQLTQKLGYPPEEVNTATGKSNGQGPIGFSAALLPLMGEKAFPTLKFTIKPDNYYNSVLILFGSGYQQGYFDFNSKGELRPFW